MCNLYSLLLIMYIIYKHDKSVQKKNKTQTEQKILSYFIETKLKPMQIDFIVFVLEPASCISLVFSKAIQYI